MKRYSNLYQQICSFENLELAYRKARKCKRYRREVLRFSSDLEENLIHLRGQLLSQTYRQGAYRNYTIYDPKKRLISALPFPDRVVQHALNNIIEPLIDKRFYHHSYACRKGRGVHRASTTITSWLRALSYNGKAVYAIKGDIKSYFKSINHDRLKAMLRRIFKDPQALWLLDLVIDSFGDIVGVPIGNLTSQILANLYLNALDKFVKEELHAQYYVRYMDDFIILAHDKKTLWGMLSRIESFLASELNLSLNPKTKIVDAKNGIDFCGYRNWKDHKKVRKTSVNRMKKTVMAFKHGKITAERLGRSYQSWQGHVRHADSFMLREKMLRCIEEAVPV